MSIDPDSHLPVNESTLWATRWQPVLAAITSTENSPQSAVAEVIEFEDAHNLVVPELYMSTAISSGGHFWDPALGGDFDRIIPANNRAASLFAAPLAAHQPTFASTDNMMLPTELGKVFFSRKANEKWRDSHYLTFYFAWLGGLTAAGANRVVEALADPKYQPFVDRLNDRSASHAERWSSYQIFTEIAAAKLARTEVLPGAKRHDGSHTLVQLVDTDHSLGCRAETVFAEIRDMTILAPQYSPSAFDEATAAEHARLTSLVGDDGHAVSVGTSGVAPVNLVIVNPR